MSGQLTSLGSMSIAVAVPLVVTAQAQITAGVGPALAELQAKVAGLVKVSAALALPSIPALAIAGAAQAVAALTLTLNSGGAALQLEGVVSTLTSLQVQIGALELIVQAAADLGTLGATAGLSLYSYAGTADSLGAAIDAATSGGIAGGPGSQNVNALLLATASSVAWSALGTVLKVS